MARSKHIVVCGAGVIGLCVAHQASLRGHRVTLVEREPEERDGCSFGNAGMIVPSHFIPLAAPGMMARGLKWMFNPRSPFYIRPRLSRAMAAWSWKFWRAANAEHVARCAPLLRDLHLASRQLFAEISEARGNDFELVGRGLLMLCRTQRALDHEAQIAGEARALGMQAHVLNAAEVAALDPGARMSVAGAVHFPLDGHLTPRRFLASITAQLKQRRVVFAWATRVQGWRLSGCRIDAVITQDGEIAADEFVLAGGSWSSDLVRELGLNIPLEPGKGYSLTLTQPRQLPRLCSILNEASVAVTPMGSTLRVGGTMELSGFDETIRRGRVRQIVDAFVRYFPGFSIEDFADVPVWRGYRPCSPDGLPYVGRFGRYANLCAATGHAMMGLSLAPITGRLVSEILSDEKPSLEIGALSPDRFA